MNTKVTYVSVDIEASGPSPSNNSMLSLGATTWDEEDDNKIKTRDFYVNLKEIEGTLYDSDTKIFWERHKEAWKQTQINKINPEFAMKWFDSWLCSLPNRPLFIAYPASFDFLWVHYYLYKFTGSCKFGWSALDMKTYAMAQLDIPFVKSQKKYWPKEWSEGMAKHNHNSLDDAREQMTLFKRMYNGRIKIA